VGRGLVFTGFYLPFQVLICSVSYSHLMLVCLSKFRRYRLCLLFQSRGYQESCYKFRALVLSVILPLIFQVFFYCSVFLFFVVVYGLCSLCFHSFFVVPFSLSFVFIRSVGVFVYLLVLWAGNWYCQVSLPFLNIGAYDPFIIWGPCFSLVFAPFLWAFLMVLGLFLPCLIFIFRCFSFCSGIVVSIFLYSLVFIL